MSDELVLRKVAKVVESQALNDEGRFSAIVSVFGNLDHQGDIIDPGAFADSVERFNAGEKFPVVWSHDYRDPFAFIGEYEVMKEVERGLYVEGVLDIADSDYAAQVFRLMRKGRIREFSIGGLVEEWYWAEPEDSPVEFHIKKLHLWEAGPCFKGANPATELLSVKSRMLQKLEAERTPDQPTGEPSAGTEPTIPDDDAPVVTDAADEPIRLSFAQLASHQVNAWKEGI